MSESNNETNTTEAPATPETAAPMSPAVAKLKELLEDVCKSMCMAPKEVSPNVVKAKLALFVATLQELDDDEVIPLEIFDVFPAEHRASILIGWTLMALQIIDD